MQRVFDILATREEAVRAFQQLPLSGVQRS
jgi:hypothetical protein